MTLTEQVYAQAAVLAGSLNDQETAYLEVFCQAAVGCLTARLRTGLTPEDCRADFVAAAALFALASLSAVEAGGLDEMKVGDVTLKRSTDSAAARCLRSQAELIIAPYMADRFWFRGI